MRTLLLQYLLVLLLLAGHTIMGQPADPSRPTATRKYVLVVMDKEQRSVVPDAVVGVFDRNKNPVEITPRTGQYVVSLPETGTFTYEVTAREYQPARGTIARPASGFIEIGLIRRKLSPQSQTIAFIAQDAFTKNPIAARFRLIGAETSTTATVTTAASPQFGTELKLKQPYSLEVESDGYEKHVQNIALDTPEAEPIKPRIVSMKPLNYEVTFSILDAVTMKPVDPTSFKIRDSDKDLNLQSAGGTRKVNLTPGKKYDIRVGQPGYELFDRSLTFDKPASGQDLAKTILLVPVKAAPVATAAPAPSPTPVAAAPKVADETVFENLKVGEAVRLDNVYFDQSSYILRTESHPQLDKLAKTLQRNPRLKIEIAGHTDNVGDDRLNTFLSENRAKVIASYLARQGIDRTRLIGKGYGSTKPVAANDSEENKSRNRRVEFVVVED